MSTLFGNRLWLPIFFITGMFLSSCKSHDKGSGDRQDSIEVSDTTEGPEMRQWLSGPVLGEWFSRLQQKDSSLEVSGFFPAETNTLPVNAGKQAIPDKEWNRYQPYFFYSPDKAKAIDLYSYGTMPVEQKNGSVKLESGEADNEVSLVDVAARTKQRILFSGPGTVYQKVVWLGDSAILITGMSDANEANKMLPVVWQVNFSDSTVKVFYYQAASDSLSAP